MNQISSEKTVWTSFLVDFGDIILNVLVMLATSSVIMLAEAFEGLSDLVASGLLLIGLRMSKQRSNKKHPFGYGKALFFWTLISALIILIFGAGLSIYFGIQRFLHPEELKQIGLAYGALGISIITNGYALSLSSRRLIGKEKFKHFYKIFFSTTHVETKNTFILDLTGTGSAIIGLFSLLLYQFAEIQYFDAIGAILIGIFAGISSLLLIWGVKDYLIGKTAPHEVEKQIKLAVHNIPEVEDIICLDTMYIGSEKLLVTLDIQINKNKITALDEIVERTKQNIKKTVPIASIIQIETHIT